MTTTATTLEPKVSQNENENGRSCNKKCKRREEEEEQGEREKDKNKKVTRKTMKNITHQDVRVYILGFSVRFSSRVLSLEMNSVMRFTT